MKRPIAAAVLLAMLSGQALAMTDDEWRMQQQISRIEQQRQQDQHQYQMDQLRHRAEQSNLDYEAYRARQADIFGRH